MEDLANYFAVIPANVRYDSTLNPNAKLLYGEIAALCNKHGVCWASNNYFAKLYNTTISTVSRWIKALKDKGYIVTEIIFKNDGKTVDKRYLSIVTKPVVKNDNTHCQNCGEGIDKNNKTPLVKNDKENNTSINNTSINIKEKNKKEKNEILKNNISNFTFLNDGTNKLLKDKILDWLDYKIERKDKPYTVTGFKALLTQISNNTKKYGVKAIINLIDNSMANNYQGIIFDSLKKLKPLEMPEEDEWEYYEYGGVKYKRNSKGDNVALGVVVDE